ncbi:MAG: allophanate hydrolase [Magnetovibrionaceae bacterium]
MASLHQAYDAGATPELVVRECYRRINALGDPGIFLHLLPLEAALEQATGLGTFDPLLKPLWGIPFAIKDNIDAAGLPTTAACPAYSYEAKQDAFVVALLKAAGAILIGKTNLDQFATGLVGVRTPYPVPKNALDPDVVPGGSSSGSAVAVAHGLVSFALGTDTAGSGRVPAALNNIVGLKPTLGMLSNSGVVPACLTLDTVSVFALTVADAHKVFGLTAQFDPIDAYSRPLPASPLGAAPPDFTVGVPSPESRKFFGDQVQADSFAAALDLLAAQGGKIVEIDFTPFYAVAEMLYEGPWVAERYAVIADLLKRSPDDVHPATRRVVKAAEKFSAADAFKAFYKLQGMKRGLAGVMASVDLFCVPSIPTFTFVDEVLQDPIEPNSRLGTYTNFVNLLDMCGLAVPVGPRSDGRPGSITLLATTGKDHLLASIGAALHGATTEDLGATGWSIPRLSEHRPVPSADEIEVAVVGAHMSGLPLNKDLTSRGARFLKATRTAPQYKFYSLPGGPPFRPGMVQAEGGEAIALEVWAMPKESFGDFMTTIPKPLGIGTVVLADGTSVKGFLCEPYALDEAEDITRFGGWRAFIEEKTKPETPVKTPPPTKSSTAEREKSNA